MNRVPRPRTRGALLGAGAAGCAVLAALAFGGNGSDASSAAPAGRSDLGPSGRAAAVRETPSLRVVLEQRDSLALERPQRPGRTLVAVLVTLKGRVPPLVAADGGPADPTGDNLLGLVVEWGDGERNVLSTPDACGTTQPLAEVLTYLPATHYYKKGGAFTVTVTAQACPPVGAVSARIPLLVKEPSPATSSSPTASP